MVVWAELRSVGRKEWVLRFDTARRSQFVVGRNPSCALVLADMHISSKHLQVSQRISPEGLREVVVEDSSSNGTWIDGERLERGVPVRLLHGSEIAFPSEEKDQQNYTFVFSERQNAKRLDGEAAEGDQAADAAMRLHLSSPLSNEEASYAHREQQRSLEQWKELEELQNQLTLEASRLAACVYANEKTMREMERVAAPFTGVASDTESHSGLTGGRSDGLQDFDEAGSTASEEPASESSNLRASRAAARGAIAAGSPSDIDQVHVNLVALAESLLDRMRQAAKVANTSAPDVAAAVCEALDLERCERAVAAISDLALQR